MRITAKTQTTMPPAERPSVPVGLPAPVKRIFVQLRDWSIAEGVPVGNLDSYALAQASACIVGELVWSKSEASHLKLARKAETALVATKHEKAANLAAGRARAYRLDLLKWLPAICATPAIRARLGIKPEPKKKFGPVALMMAAKQRQAQ